ncbi:AraC family transcriptional regulator [Paenibacillus monticola]|uniref:Helix-turn-helix domain-containing protein n=1 Tax=Paenibacillus monticola TaxID=2666075 RepID=A0A7X2H3R4_9BACL|nr:AraC family transcriptional regulator [Paenibacillus monticola]MRN53026.1 helix-turn-helix domain-containing protein [Paenibacillus monticola]
MPTHSSDGMQHISHPFYIPSRVKNLTGLSVNQEKNVQQSHSLILMIVWGGSGHIDVNAVQYKLAAGSILTCIATTSLKLNPQLQLQGIWIEYSNLGAHQPDICPLNYSIPIQECSSKILAQASAFYSAWMEPKSSMPLAVQQLFTELIAELFYEMDGKQQTGSSWFDQVLSYIDAHYNEDLTREKVARLAGVSPEHFSRTFRKNTGQTFNAYLTLLRIRRAQQRLLTGAPNLATLALEVGYGEGTYLSRKFKQIVGISPTAYQQKNKKVVTLNYNHTATLRVLQIRPTLGAYSAWSLKQEQVPFAQELRLGSSSASFLYDSVASVQPDVIISYSLEAENKNLLSLAPVIELPFMQMSWREQFCLIAEVVDRQRRAEEWLIYYDELCDSANVQLNQCLGSRGTAIVWEVSSRCAYCFSSSYGRGCQILYGDLGFKPPSILIEQGIVARGYIETTIEEITAYPADHIFITGIPSSIEGKKRLYDLFHSPSWLQLEAARSNHVYVLNQSDLFYGFDPMSSQAQLHVLLSALIS